MNLLKYWPSQRERERKWDPQRAKRQKDPQAKFLKVILSAFLSMEAKSFKTEQMHLSLMLWEARDCSTPAGSELRVWSGGGRLFLLLYWSFWNGDVQRLAVLLRSMQHAEAHTFIQPCMWWHTMSGLMRISLMHIFTHITCPWQCRNDFGVMDSFKMAN